MTLDQVWWFWPIVWAATWGLLIPAFRPYIRSLLARIAVAELTAQGTIVIGLLIGMAMRCWLNG